MAEPTPTPPPRPSQLHRPRRLVPAGASIVLAVVLIAAVVATNRRSDDTRTATVGGESPTTASESPSTTAASESTTTTEATATSGPTTTTTPGDPAPSTTVAPATDWAAIDSIPAGDGDRQWAGRGPAAITCGRDIPTCIVAGAMVDPAGVAHATVFVSSDGGDTWTSTLSSAAPSGLSSLTCAPGDVCLAGGASCDPVCAPVILVSADGGVTWVQAQITEDDTTTLATEASVVQSLSCSTSSECLATVGEPWSYGLLRSSDGGETWAAAPMPGGAAVATAQVHCAPNGPCLIGATVYDQGLAAYGSVYRSVDGIEWHPVELPTPVAAMVNFACIDTASCYAAGTLRSGEAVVLDSDDEGLTWRQRSVLAPTEAGLHAAGIACPANDACAVLLTDGIGTWQIRSGAGETWTTTDGPSGRVSGVACDVTRRCLVVGSPRAADLPPIVLRGML